jgi:hypothetical protein
MAVLMLHKGPYDGMIMNKTAPGLELRVSDDNKEEAMVQASIYRRRGDLDDGPIVTGSYVFLDNVLSANSLVDIWLGQG